MRQGGFVLLLAVFFVLVNAQVVHAADSNATGDLLAPLNIYSSEGVPIDGYELNAEGEGILDFRGEALSFALSGLFMLIRLLVGMAGWAIEAAFRFPLLKLLAAPAQKAADTYDTIVVDTLGVKGLLLAWSFVFTGFMIVRGRVGRGLGEMVLTLLIAAFAASTLIRPDTLLAADGPLGQSTQVAAEVAEQSVNSYDWGGKLASKSPCDGMAGQQELKCLQREGEGPVSAAEVARPLQDSITNALVVKPYMLLQYGRILDPAKPSDRKAYAVHLKWITGGYKPGNNSGETGEDDDKDDPCDKIWGPAKKYCQRNNTGTGPAEVPEPAENLPLDALNAQVTEGHREFAAFLADLKESGDVGKASAEYAQKPTWWRIGGALLLLVAALFIAGMMLSCALVLLGVQGACAGAAAAAGVTFVAAMLPGPARQSVWKWLSLWGIACLAVIGVCAFIPFFAIAVDATITDGPDLMVERMLLIVALAVVGAAMHRRLLAGISGFGRRMAMRMRYAKIGGTHLPGDTSELGAALAMNTPSALGGYGGGLRALAAARGGGGGRFGILGTRQRLTGALSSMADGTGMPVDTGRLLSDATAEAGRGLAPLTAGAAIAGLGARLTARGGHWLLIGRRPDREQFARWQRPTAEGDDNPAIPGGPAGPGGPGGGPGGGPIRPRGRVTATATRTGRSSTAPPAQSSTTRTPTARCSPRGPTTGWSASAATASSTAPPAPPTAPPQACPPTRAAHAPAPPATPMTPASKSVSGAIPSARTAAPGETPHSVSPGPSVTATTAADRPPSPTAACPSHPQPRPRRRPRLPLEPARTRIPRCPSPGPARPRPAGPRARQREAGPSRRQPGQLRNQAAAAHRPRRQPGSGAAHRAHRHLPRPAPPARHCPHAGPTPAHHRHRHRRRLKAARHPAAPRCPDGGHRAATPAARPRSASRSCCAAPAPTTSPRTRRPRHRRPGRRSGAGPAPSPRTRKETTNEPRATAHHPLGLRDRAAGGRGGVLRGAGGQRHHRLRHPPSTGGRGAVRLVTRGRECGGHPAEDARRLQEGRPAGGPVRAGVPGHALARPGRDREDRVPPRRGTQRHGGRRHPPEDLRGSPQRLRAGREHHRLPGYGQRPLGRHGHR
ncbi:hypothetical protein ABZZ79_36125 [Streptomyces sp. NPDC006458]|uniref:hypothetical protein n=1 Tax=Streptomyces sp. NPDC006458 TaxID=3154302 RepID=UPI0033BB9E82